VFGCISNSFRRSTEVSKQKYLKTTQLLKGYRLNKGKFNRNSLDAQELDSLNYSLKANLLLTESDFNKTGYDNHCDLRSNL